MPASPRLILCLAALLASEASAAERKVVIRGNGTDLGPTPVVVEVPGGLEPGDYLLAAEGQGPTLGANVFEDGGKTHLGLVLPALGAEESRTYTLRGAEAARQGRGDELPCLPIRASSEGGQVRVEAGDGPFVSLVLGARKPYFYPVIGPTGGPFTRAYPMEDVDGEDRDHPHQRSFWFTHGDVNGFDFWASDPKNGDNPKFGTITQTACEPPIGGLAVGRLRTRNDWIGGDGKKVCEDERVFTFSAARDRRFIDVDVTIRATAGPVTFGDTKEGMFGLRVPSVIDVKRKQGGKIVNAEGVADNAAWGKPSPWVDYAGPVGGKVVGVAILNHPESFRYPTTWHVRDYGLFAANPFGYRDFGLDKPGAHTVPAGDAIRFRYRVVLHAGDAGEAKIASAFEAFARPPAVELKAE
jgi:hypothetical protein